MNLIADQQIEDGAEADCQPPSAKNQVLYFNATIK